MYVYDIWSHGWQIKTSEKILKINSDFETSLIETLHLKSVVLLSDLSEKQGENVWNACAETSDAELPTYTQRAVSLQLFWWLDC